MMDYKKYKRLNKEYRNQRDERLKLVNEFLSHFGLKIEKNKKRKKKKEKNF